MYEKEEIIEDYIREELSDVPNILNNELSLNGMNFQLRKEFDFIKWHVDEFLEKTTILSIRLQGLFPSYNFIFF